MAKELGLNSHEKGLVLYVFPFLVLATAIAPPLTHSCVDVHRSAFFIGYIGMQIPGGIIVGRVGGTIVFQLALFFSNLFTLAVPFVANKLGYPWLVVLRVVTGFAEGAMYTAMFDVLRHWCPPLERSRIFSIAGAGNSTGVILALPVSGLLAGSSWGWPSVFYAFGGLGLLYNIAYQILGSDSPAKDRFISKEELVFIEEAKAHGVPAPNLYQSGEYAVPPVYSSGTVNFGSRADETLEADPNASAISDSLLRQNDASRLAGGRSPYLVLLTNRAFYVVTLITFVGLWGAYTALTELPSYMNDVLKFNVKKAGVSSVVPYIVSIVLMTGSAAWQDHLVSKGTDVTLVRRLFLCIGSVVAAGFLVAVGYVSSPTLGVTLMSAALGASGVATAAMLPNISEIAPEWSAITLSLSNTAGTAAGIISPILTGAIVTDKTPAQWREVFFLAAGLYVLGAVVFALFGTAKSQIPKQ